MSSAAAVRPQNPQAHAAGAETHRIVVRVSGGFDGALRVATVLRSRAYRVRHLSAEVPTEGAESRVGCTVALTSAAVPLLLERLRRLPAVLSADEV